MRTGRLWITVLLATLVAAASAPVAAGGAESRPIVITEGPTGQSPTENIFTLDARGRNKKRLTSDGRSLEAVLSPDGRWIAYAKRFSDQFELMLMRVDGSGKRRLSTTAARNELPTSWSPDSRRIVFTSTSARGGVSSKDGVFVIRRDGSGRRRLLGQRFAQVDWSPVGRQLVAVRAPRDWTSPHQPSQVVRINADGSGVKVLAGGEFGGLEPRWSPDGRQVVYQEPVVNTFTGSVIKVVNADGSGRKTLVDTPGQDYHPSWSPDGGTIVFWGSATQSYPSSLFSYNISTGKLTRLRASFTRSIDWS